jgi:hypothetical protein
MEMRKHSATKKSGGTPEKEASDQKPKWSLRSAFFLV